MDTFSGMKSNTGLCIGCKFSYCWKRDKGIHVDECPEYTPKDKEQTDMVEVVRCKDCKHWNRNMMSGRYPDNVMCKCCEYTHNQFTGYTGPYDYCSFAKRVQENEHE